MLIKSQFIFITSLILLFTSCTYRRKLVYFQGNLKNETTNISYSPTLKPDDIISINIQGMDESTTKPFNLQTSINQNIGGYSSGTPAPPGYLIDSDGFIDFPILGKVKLGGLSRISAIDTLKKKLNQYVNNPTILIRILNFKVTVLGEVRNPGTFNIPNERVTLLEAIGIAGDLQITGLRKNVLVIREENGKRNEVRIDLTNKDFFNGPYYYLQQNDIVYVEPNRTKINSAAVNTTNVSLAISVISLFVTMVVLFRQ